MYEPASDADISEIVALMNRAYRDKTGSGWCTEDGYIEGERTNEPLLRAELALDSSASLLKWKAGEDERIVGCVWLAPLDDSTWYLGSFAIDPAVQNGGLGRTMLQAAEDWAQARGATRIRMSVVNVRETLIAWYLRRGYRRTEQTEPFPYGDDRWGTPLRDDLHFVVLEKPI